MAHSHLKLPSFFLVFVLSIVANQCFARRNALHFSTSKLTGHGIQSNNNAEEANKAIEEKLVSAGVVRATPARPMPSYNQNAAPVPLPEFPTLGPPIVWSFPAAPLPALEGPPPQDLPALPRTGSKHIGAPSPCHGGPHIHHTRLPPGPPSVPFIAAEPAVTPGPLEAPESAPEPTAGGPSSPPY